MISAVGTFALFLVCSAFGVYLDRKFGTTDLMLGRYQEGALMY